MVVVWLVGLVEFVYLLNLLSTKWFSRYSVVLDYESLPIQ
jgi:hypothetical protein